MDLTSPISNDSEYSYTTEILRGVSKDDTPRFRYRRERIIVVVVGVGGGVGVIILNAMIVCAINWPLLYDYSIINRLVVHVLLFDTNN